MARKAGLQRRLEEALGSKRWPQTAFATLAVWFVLVLLLESGLSVFLENRVVRPLEFRARDALQRAPQIAPTIKAYALDDSTAAMIGGTELSIKDWIRLIEAMAARKPRAILIDAMFSSDTKLTDEEKNLVIGLSKYDTPIVVGALITQIPIRYRAPLPSALFQKAWNETSERSLRLRSDLGAHAYGPAPSYLGAFRYVGHIVQEWPTKFAPAIKIGEETVVPHFSLYAAYSRQITQDGISVNDTTLPLDRDGLVPINYLPPLKAGGRFKSLRSVILSARKGLSITGIDPGDTVVIANNYSSGNTDMHDSPFGAIPGGFIILSLVNSVITDQWLTRIEWALPLTLSFATVGTLLGLLCTSVSFWPYLLGVAAFHVGASLLSFSYLSLIVPWFFPATGLFLGGMTTYVLQRYQESKRRIHLEMEMATASALQQQFFPEPYVSHPKFSLAIHYQPADSVGGDWYSWYIHRQDWLHLHLGDVTGHGTAAALLASFAKGATDMIYEDYAQETKNELTLQLLHGHLNEMMVRNRGSEALMTMLSLAVNLHSGECYCLNSGHRPALMFRPDTQTTSVLTRQDSSILGYRSFTKAPLPRCISLMGNEIFLILSDGLLDVPQHYGEKATEKVLAQLVKELAHEPVEIIREEILKRLGFPTFQLSSIADDVTFLVVKLSGFRDHMRVAVKP